MTMTLEEILDELQEHHGATISKGAIHYSVTLWDCTIDAYQDLELTEDELIDLYEEYFKQD
jgi:hypothetical protein